MAKCTKWSLTTASRWPRSKTGQTSHRGTKVTFTPAATFGKVEFHFDILAKRIRELSF